jgi:hypothetical protein
MGVVDGGGYTIPYHSSLYQLFPLQVFDDDLCLGLFLLIFL